MLELSKELAKVREELEGKVGEMVGLRREAEGMDQAPDCLDCLHC